MNSINEFVLDLKALAYSSGFSHCGVVSAIAMPEAEVEFRKWLSHSHHSKMAYLEKNTVKRFNPTLLFEGAKSIISLAWPYGDAAKSMANRSGIALYAWGEDYHIHMRNRALPLIAALESYAPGSVNKFYTDSAFLSERSHAVRAGLGWVGKNGTLITPESGSMVLLAEVVTTVELPVDKPFAGDHCGECTKCIDACPTGALTASKTLIAARCISYQTNTSKEPIPTEIAKVLGGRIYGCDICQEVCPWNHRKVSGSEKPVVPGPAYPEGWPERAADWLDKDEAWFEVHFKGTALAYKGFDKLRSNAESAVYASEEAPQEKPSV